MILLLTDMLGTSQNKLNTQCPDTRASKVFHVNKILQEYFKGDMRFFRTISLK